jgi:hypothetical protein
MSPIQEALNAFSMLLPLLVLAHAYHAHPTTQNFLLFLGSAMHIPSSFTYHMSAAFGRYPCRLDNDMRRLDQSMQHVVGTIYTYALSDGSTSFTLASVALNAYGIAKLWDPATSNDNRRWILVMLSVILYTLPVICINPSQHIRRYIMAVASVLLGGACAFIPKLNTRLFRGWGHTIFHSALAIHAHALSSNRLTIHEHALSSNSLAIHEHALSSNSLAIHEHALSSNSLAIHEHALSSNSLA